MERIYPWHCQSWNTVFLPHDVRDDLITLFWATWRQFHCTTFSMTSWRYVSGDDGIVHYHFLTEAEDKLIKIRSHYDNLDTRSEEVILHRTYSHYENYLHIETSTRKPSVRTVRACVYVVYVVCVRACVYACSHYLHIETSTRKPSVSTVCVCVCVCVQPLAVHRDIY